MSGSGSRRINLKLHLDKDIIIISSMIVLVSAVLIINAVIAIDSQHAIERQNNKIISDVDYNRKAITTTLKEIGNATKQQAIEDKLDAHIADLQQSIKLVNQTNAKIDRLLKLLVPVVAK